MNAERYKVIGMMSGTSLDGLDMSYCHYQKDGDGWKFQLLKSNYIPYQQERKAQLTQLVNESSENLMKAHHDYGQWLGQQVHQFVEENDLQVDLVASHGHTIFHQPQNKFTFQLGDGHDLALSCGLKVIADFRSKDVATGGQGAPLVPIGDQLLFSDYDLCLNLGGIANISFSKNGKRIAGDIAPANMLLNHICSKIDKSFDEGGKLARSGKVHTGPLQQFNKVTYYQSSFPKSTGYEWFAEKILPIVDGLDMSIPDLLCTSVEHIAFQIKDTIINEAPDLRNKKMLVTGGGALNHFLIERLSNLLQGKIEVVVPNESLINFKEAIVFGLMGILRLRKEPNCIASVTGASHNVSGGVIYEPA